MVVAVETYFQNGKWHNRFAGESKPVHNYPDHAEALEQGRMLATLRAIQRGGTCNHLIHDEGGKIIAEETYPGASGPPG